MLVAAMRRREHTACLGASRSPRGRRDCAARALSPGLATLESATRPGSTRTDTYYQLIRLPAAAAATTTTTAAATTTRVLALFGFVDSQ